MSDISVHVKGVDAVVRSFDRKIDGMEHALDEGCQESADHLKQCIEDKFGVYQPGWAQLKEETIWKEVKAGAGANARKPLIEWGDMKNSFRTKISNRSRKHTVTIESDDPKLVHHVYGAPDAGVPRRDPVRPTVKEENNECIKIITDKVREVMGL